MSRPDTPDVTAFFDAATSSVSYVVTDPATGICAVIDPVLDYDSRSGHLSMASMDKIAAFIADNKLQPRWILDTHIHADHLSGLDSLRQRLGGMTGIGDQVIEVQGTFASYYNLGADIRCDGSQFDHLFADAEEFRVGGLAAQALHVPGHTPACTAYLIGDCLFVGDSLLMPDFGTARCDFPGGDAATLYHSIRRLLALPDQTRVFVGHDYGPGGRAIAWETTIADQRNGNIHVNETVSEEMFVELRTSRDMALELPALMLAAVQVNIRGGRLPTPDSNGVSYLKIPLTR
ncbi:MBL fold metallo-hydrolase [Magnetospirillum sulfuroxidans]|uniref:MBL fold metallo-hydrolase n=1 Tax=Magnetospirillum sulfuroxidans TaxID=611300 RepID=A0ABS5I6W0_9PROT|nr:MBL fold metallo-hydrolase [Magnetospirillum sulfuroxidans]MBR9970153.1 MBL fold metallo-hydrolase [Magnetospirillum sulfuroxidans]